MKKIILFIISSSFIFASFHADENNFDSDSNGFSITDLYLIEHPLELIKSTLFMREFDKQIQVMKELIANEKQYGFFGYHGCSQRYRVFQDILRAVFEESLGYEIPSDFQFLRIPGDEMFNLKNGKHSFYKLFDRKGVSDKKKRIIIDELYIKPFNGSYGSKIKVTDLSKEERNDVWEITQEFLEILDSLALEDYGSYEFKEDKKLVSLDPFSSNESEDDKYLESIRKKMEMIIQKLDANEVSNSLESLSSMSSKVTLHSIFMRILKIKDKKVKSDRVLKYVKENFTFREMICILYRLSYSDVDQLERYFFPYNDHIPGQQSRIVCLNMPLFGNYYRLGECSLYGFLGGYSIAGGDGKVTELLEDYFESIGLARDLPQVLQDIGYDEINKSTLGNGSILQFFDNSKELYKGANASAYVSHSFGIPLKHLEPSQLLLNEHPIQINKLDLQLRLIPCNHTTLNPYSFLRIVRVDAQEPEVSRNIIQLMRNKLKNGVVNPDKLNTYKDKMDAIWGQK